MHIAKYVYTCSCKVEQSCNVARFEVLSLFTLCGYGRDVNFVEMIAIPSLYTNSLLCSVKCCTGTYSYYTLACPSLSPGT